MASWPPSPAGGGSAYGVKTRASGDWFFPYGAWVSSTMTPGADQVYAQPWLADSSFTLAAIQLDVTAGQAGTTVGLGLYADNGGRPGALVIDGGTVSGAAIAQPVAILTPAPAIVAGTVYWLAVCAHGATPPTVRSCGTNSVTQPVGIRVANPGPPGAQAGSIMGFVQTGVTGALPNPFTGTTFANNSIRVGLQVA